MLPQIVAFGGGGFSTEAGNPLLDDYVLGLTGVARPRVCFVPTASGDADHYVVRFYRAFGPRAEASHVSLFRRERGVGGVSFANHLLAQDVIYVTIEGTKPGLSPLPVLSRGAVDAGTRRDRG